MDSEQIRAVCPVCIRLVACDSVSDAKELINSHNESMHDEEDVGFVIRETAEGMAEFLEAVKEQATEEDYKSLRNQLAKGNADVFMSSREFNKMNDLLDHDTKQYRY